MTKKKLQKDRYPQKGFKGGMVVQRTTGNVSNFDRNEENPLVLIREFFSQNPM